MKQGKISRTRGDRVKVFREMGVKHADGIISSLHNAGKLSVCAAIELLEKGDLNARLKAGEMALEQAYGSLSVLDVSTWLGRAKDNLTTVIERHKIAVPHANGTVARAMIHLAQMPNHASIVASGRLPSLAVTEKSYQNTLETAIVLADKFHEQRKQKTTNVATLAGALGETAVLLLGQRYALKSIGDGSWLPMLSHFSEDNANRRAYETNHAWDVSIFTDFGEGIDLAERIQVKTSRDAKQKHVRQDDIEGITRVCLRPDLMLDPRESFSVTSVIRECQQEQTGRMAAANRLDQRTDLLLDIVG